MLAAAAGCAAASDDTAAEPPATAPPMAANAAAVVRTADPVARGLADADFPRLQELADGVYSYEQLRGTGDDAFTTVSMFVVTSEGVLVADGQGNVEETQRMLDTIGTITDQPITHVVVCSDHGDHTGGNSAFPESATLIAHPTSAAALEASAARAAQREGSAPVPLADELVADELVLQLGGKEIRIVFLGRAHTGGDLSVYLPAERVLFMSEAFLNRVFPAMRSAFPSEWVATIERAQAMDVETYVPGHGFVESPAVLEEELETYRQAIVQVIAEGRRLHDAGLSLDEAIEQASFGELEDWKIRSSQGPVAIRQVYRELNGELPPSEATSPRAAPSRSGPSPDGEPPAGGGS
jgi:glyoxylase-like metal-dependent hydrolase (beta-lactamase superfamily II)